MLIKLFRTKERGFLISLIVITIILGSGAFFCYRDRREPIDQAVMAENYLKAGNYEEAVKAYQKAFLIKRIDRQQLSIGLADAYVGMEDYDKALEVLRACYQTTYKNEIKEKIEEVTTEKIEATYQQATYRAEVYYSKEEYDKAISEYEKAKKIKSKEIIPYIRIAQAYIAKGEYEHARKEALEGQELTQAESFEDLLNLADMYIMKRDYDALIKQAEEYVAQENYEDSIINYQKAIKLWPEESTAYQGLAEVYIIQQKYRQAEALLVSAIEKTQSDELEALLEEVSKQIDTEDNTSRE
jgi:tetratricopeptide (TPR) repeat protein